MASKQYFTDTPTYVSEIFKKSVYKTEHLCMESKKIYT